MDKVISYDAVLTLFDASKVLVKFQDNDAAIRVRRYLKSFPICQHEYAEDICECHEFIGRRFVWISRSKTPLELAGGRAAKACVKVVKEMEECLSCMNGIEFKTVVAVPSVRHGRTHVESHLGPLIGHWDAHTWVWSASALARYKMFGLDQMTAQVLMDVER